MQINSYYIYSISNNIEMTDMRKATYCRDFAGNFKMKIMEKAELWFDVGKNEDSRKIVAN